MDGIYGRDKVSDLSRPTIRRGAWRTIDRFRWIDFYRNAFVFKLPALPNINSQPGDVPQVTDFSLPPPPKLSGTGLWNFRHKMCAFYTLAWDWGMPPYPEVPGGGPIWDTIYKIWLPGPKNIHRLLLQEEFPIARVHFEGPNSNYNKEISSSVIRLGDLVSWHRRFAEQTKRQMVSDPDRLRYAHSFRSTWRGEVFRESFEKIFIFVDKMATYHLDGVLLVVVDQNVDLEKYVGKEAKHSSGGEMRGDVEGDMGCDPGWTVYRVSLEHAIEIVKSMKPDLREKIEGEIVVECGWQDREQFGRGTPIAKIWP